MRVVLYTKQDCGLCERAEDVISRARREIIFDLERVFVDNDGELLELYGDRVPVVAVNGHEVASAPVDEGRLLAALVNAA